MYKHIAFNQVSLNFSVQFKVSISPYFDRQKSCETGKLEFISAKFVKYLATSRGYGGKKVEPLEDFVRRRFGDAAWVLLKRLMY